MSTCVIVERPQRRILVAPNNVPLWIGGRGGVNLGEKEIAMQGAQSGSSKARDVAMGGYGVSKMLVANQKDRVGKRQGKRQSDLAQADANAKHDQIVNALQGIGGADEGGSGNGGNGGDVSMTDAESKNNGPDKSV